MTTRGSSMVTCSRCGTASRLPFIGSTNRMGAPDLDVRPPSMLRETIDCWIQDCTACGYAATDISVAEDGIDAVLDRKEGCARYELPDDRMGDVIVVSGGPKGSKVLGTSRDKHDLSGLNEPLRSHGGLTEQEIPVIANRKFKEAPATLRNFDAFALGCNHIVEN